jgi:hypothetical protein
MKTIHNLLFECFLLLEYDRDKTIAQHGDKALKVALGREEHGDSYLRDVQGLHQGRVKNSHPGTNEEKAKHELMSQFEEADPTPQKKYVQHIARIYGNGGFNRHEDVFSRGKPALRDFHDLASRKIIPAEHRDIGRYKTLNQIEDIVDAHKDKTSARQEDKTQHEKMKGQATITEHNEEYPENGFTHIIPHTPEAAAHFGKGTRWCTAATDDPEDQERTFSEYNQDGPLHIYIPHKASYPGEKYQYHYSSNQIMNEKDHPVALPGRETDRVGHIEHEGILNHIAEYEDEANKAKNSIEGLNHPEISVRKHVLMNHPDVSHQDIINAATKDYDKYHNEWSEPSEGVYSHPKFDDTVVDHIVRNGRDVDLGQLLYHTQIYGKDDSDREKYHKELRPDQISHLLTRQVPDGSFKPWKGYTPSWPGYLASAGNLSREQKVMAAKGEGIFSGYGGFGHRRDMTDEDIDLIKNHGSRTVKQYFIAGNEAAKKHAKHFLNDPDDEIKLSALNSPWVHSQDKIDTIEKRPDLEEKYVNQYRHRSRPDRTQLISSWKATDPSHHKDDPRTNLFGTRARGNNGIIWHGR